MKFVSAATHTKEEDVCEAFEDSVRMVGRTRLHEDQQQRKCVLWNVRLVRLKGAC